MGNYSNYGLNRTQEALRLAQNLSEYVRSRFKSRSAGCKRITVINHTTRKEQTHEKQHRCIQV